MISHPWLRSLLDMYQIDMSTFVEISRVCGLAEGFKMGVPAADQGKPMTYQSTTGPVSTEGMATWFKAVKKDCLQLGLRTSAKTCERIVQLFQKEGATFGELRGQYEEFHGRLRDELSSARCFAIDARYDEFFTDRNRYGPEVATRFPSTEDDIEESGKCLACARATASVFHLMRVLEIGLQAFADKLGIGLDKDRNWQAIINDVNGAIKRLPNSTATEKEFLGKCSAAAIFLQQVKDAWRNDVMHPRASYTETQADEIDGVTKSLMVKLVEFV